VTHLTCVRKGEGEGGDRERESERLRLRHYASQRVATQARLLDWVASLGSVTRDAFDF